MVYTIEELRERVAPIAERHGVERVWLFGSYARGEATEESDVDFRIKSGRIEDLFALAGFQIDLEGEFGKKVDVISAYNPDDKFFQRIAEDEVTLYG